MARESVFHLSLQLGPHVVPKRGDEVAEVTRCLTTSERGVLQDTEHSHGAWVVIAPTGYRMRLAPTSLLLTSPVRLDLNHSALSSSGSPRRLLE